MATIAPYIPESITVHLGSPDSNAENVTVSFSDYVKNVLSSEVYPTWEPAALRANALAIISFALNRIYTEYYRSRGYSFDITSSTAIDQKFINGRNIYENISELVDELFTDYLRKQGFVEPLAAKFCNGVTVTCSGLSQWGSQYLAQDGANSIDILRTYYGEDVEFVTNAPVQNLQESYPGSPVRRGDIGVNVSFLQVALNRISQNYPAIPKVPVDAIFGEATENAVRAFQSIFSLTVDGIVGRATWYTIVMLYTAVLKLGELQSLGQTFYGYSWEYPDPARRTGREGDAPAIYAVRCFPVQFRRAGAAGQRCVWRHNHAGRHNVPACLRPAGNRHSRPRDVGQHLFAVCGHRDDRFRKRSALPVHASADGCDGG